jgi:hypothetical protein
MCTLSCARGCGTCPTGSACHPVGLNQDLYCLRSCTSGTCAQGQQCAQLPTGRGCMPSCGSDVECPVGTVCRFGECVLFGSDDAGCPFCPTDQDGGGNAPRKDAGTGGGGNGSCGCTAAGGLQTIFALWLMVSFATRRRR